MPGLLLVAYDDGARATMEPLAMHPEFHLVQLDPIAQLQETYWRELIADARALIVGTSDSESGRCAEAAARRAATRVRLPIMAIEDYAGNYSEVADAATELLVVESDLAEALHHKRLGAACPRIKVFSSPRYDPYRVQTDTLRTATRARWADAGQVPRILWAGQPESEDNLETLRRVGAAVRDVGAMLLVKSHPRDPLGQQRFYSRLLDSLGIEHVDVSTLTVAASLEQAPQLVLTQFSSLAIEAGFYGIPALHLLYDDVGGARLRQKKGYGVPQHCHRGAAFVIKNRGCELQLLRQALLDQSARDSVISCFDDFFATHTLTAPLIADYLVRVMGLT